MPNLKSAKKRLRQSEKARQHNLSAKTQIKSLRKSFMEAVVAEDSGKADEAFRKYCSVLDKGVKKNVIKKNTSIRRKARAADKLRARA